MNAENTKVVDIGRALDDGEWTRYGKFVMVLATFAFLVDGIAGRLMSVAIPALTRAWGAPRGAFADVLALNVTGAAIGAVIAGALADRFGRKTILVGGILVYGLATLAASLASNVHQLWFICGIDGLGIGSTFPIAGTLIAEYTPMRRRSRAINIGLVGYVLGNIVTGLLGGAILPTLGWQALFQIAGAVSIGLFILLVIIAPESPRFLLHRPQRRDELLRLLKRLQMTVDPSANLIDSAQGPRREPLSQLFSRRMLAITLPLSGAIFTCQMSTSMGLNWVPSLLSSRGYPLAETSLGLSAWSFGGLIGHLVGAWLIELYGSRRALAIMAAAGAVVAVSVSFLPLDPAHSFTPILLGLGSQGFCFGGLGGCLYALAASIYPPSIRATGVGMTSAVSRSSYIFASYAGAAMIAIGSQAFFIFIAVTLVACLMFIVVTKGHIPKDIRV